MHVYRGCLARQYVCVPFMPRLAKDDCTFCVSWFVFFFNKLFPAFEVVAALSRNAITATGDCDDEVGVGDDNDDPRL